MPRGSSGGRSSFRSAPRLAAARSRSPPPQPVHHAPPPAPAQRGGGSGSIFGGIGSAIAQGVAFGTGSAVAHRAADAVMGPRTVQHEHVAAAAAAPTASSMGGADACDNHSKAFQDCVNNYGSEISKCQFYLDMLKECKRNSDEWGACTYPFETTMASKFF